VHLELVVNPIYNDTIYAQRCGIAYDENNFYETESGVYTQHLQTINGCDSIVTLNLNVWDLFTDSLYVEIYSGDIYKQHGFLETTSGEYTQIYIDENGCDSTYFLHLDVINLKFPNVVTANGDGINDVFEIIGLLNNTYFSHTELLIYTRHGRRVYFKGNIQHESEFWSPAATNSASGTYFFRFIAQSKTRTFDFNGTIEVFK
jgi:gliding motility-associated-like protein